MRNRTERIGKSVNYDFLFVYRTAAQSPGYCLVHISRTCVVKADTTCCVVELRHTEVRLWIFLVRLILDKVWELLKVEEKEFNVSKGCTADQLFQIYEK